MKLTNRIGTWWHGEPSIIKLTNIANGGLRLSYPDPNYVPARVRFEAAMSKPPVKWTLGAIGAIVVAVASAAIIKSLGLS